MGHTNSTVNYNLPQFVGTDKPSWLGDVNGAFLAIDTAIAAAKTQADSAAGGVAGLQTTVGSHTTQIGTLTDTVTAQGGTLNTVTALIGNGTPTTTDQTIIGAINEINAKVGVKTIEVTADGVKNYSQLLDQLFALISTANAFSTTSYLIDDTVVAPLTFYSEGTSLSFTRPFISSQSLGMADYLLKALNSPHSEYRNGVYTDRSSVVPTAGIKISYKYFI